MGRQVFDTVEVARLLVRNDWTDLPNLVTNPSGADGTTSGWRVSNPNTATVLATPAGLQVTRTGAAGPLDVTLFGELAAVTPAADRYVRARAIRVTGTPGRTARIGVQVFRTPTSPIILTPPQGPDTPGDGAVLNAPTAAVSSLSALVRPRIVFAAMEPGETVTFRDATVVFGTNAAVTAASMEVEPDWLEILGSSKSLIIERDELQLGTLSAEIIDAALDPASTGILRTGKQVRAQAFVQGAWGNLIDAKVLTARTAYELKDPHLSDEKRSRISITAVDNLTRLANTPRSEGVSTIAELPYVLEASGVAWIVNGSPAVVDPDAVTIVSKNESASAVDQVAIARDSALGYAWVDRNGVLQAWDASAIPTTVVDVLDDTVYSGADIDFDAQRAANTITIKVLDVDPATGETSESVFGPFVDQDSVRNWGALPAEFTVQGLDEADLPAYAAAILATNAEPVLRINSVTVPILTPADVDAHALRDLYDLVQVSNERSGLGGAMRIVSVKHTITPGKWLLETGFAADGSVAPPQVTPSPTAGGMTIGQRLRPVGEITMFYGLPSAVPPGWLVCDGSQFDPVAYPRLKAVLGGGTTLPNLVDRFPIGAGVKALGDSGGNPTKPTPPHVHSVEIADHTHSITAQEGGAEQTAEAGTTKANLAPFGAFSGHNHGGQTGAVSGANPTATSSDPDGDPFDVMPPWRAVHFIIRAA